MSKHLLYTLLLAAGSLLTFHACSLDIPPADEQTEITNTKDARSLLSSAYRSYPHFEYQLSLLSDDFCPTTLSRDDTDQKNLYQWQDLNISENTENVWNSYYTTIAGCNALLDRMGEVVTEGAEDEAEKACIEAEAKTLKAMCYFDLLRLFAPAYSAGTDKDGIILKDNFVYGEDVARTSIGDCVEHIRTLLFEAKDVDNQPTSNGWLSQTAVIYLLAELELYAQNYGQAAQYAEQVLDKADDSMFAESAFAQLWSAGACNARIFSFYTDETFYTNIQSFDMAAGDMYMLNPVVNTYAETDVRKAYHVYEFPEENDGTNVSCYVGKYNKMNREGTTIQYINTMRYAGAYFIAAEAYSRQSGQEDKAAVLNDYLEKVGAAPVDMGLRGEALTQAILTEKQKEFVGEGVRYFDLKRTRKATDTLQRLNNDNTGVSGTIKGDDYRWTFPIPKSEYLYNDAVSQNDGWPTNRPNQ